MTTLRIAASVLLFAVLVPASARAQDAPSTPSLGATGSAPPWPQDPHAENETLARDEKKDSGRVLEVVWANAEAGFAYVNMQSLNSSNFQIQNSSSAGGMFGVGVGVRLLVFTLGARARLNELSAFTLWETNGELGVHIPIKKWDPYLSLHGGYTFVGTLNSAALGASLSSAAGDFSVHGADAGLSIGVDYYLIPYLSIGLDLTGDALFLSRPAASLPAVVNDLPPAEQSAIKASGDAVGIGASGSFHVGLHI